MKVSAQDFTYISSLAKTLSALELDEGKEYLVESRLAPVATEAGCTSLEALCTKLRSENGYGPLSNKVVDALTTNETLFFRDFHPFETLRLHLLPELIERRAALRRLTIWSAACSTGQEPYSLAMLMNEHFPQLADWDIRITATDISPTVLAKARSGRYTKLEVNRGLPAVYLIKYFQSDNKDWVLKEHVRKMIDFRELNLIGSWAGMGMFDLIFIRNVLIYMNSPTKMGILGNMRKHMADDGSLLLGSAETLLGESEIFRARVVNNSVVYQPAG
ncbi:MAG: protein-glutamate O-methyltransferase CheR [Acidobacteriota bacterium]